MGDTIIETFAPLARVAPVSRMPCWIGACPIEANLTVIEATFTDSQVTE